MIIKIKNLKARTIIGVFDWEKKQERDLFINLEMQINASQAIQSDNIQDTLDYDTISKTIIQETAKTRFDLIEKLAAHLLDIIMQDERIIYSKIEIDKPGAIKQAESVSVVHERKR